MSDQGDQQTPPQATAGIPAVPTDSVLKATVKDLWAKYSIFFIIVGILLLVAKFGDIAMNVLAWKSKKDVEEATKTDTRLRAEENTANQQANDLVKQAQDLPKTEGKVDENWNKKRS
jgi:hypothetical protein